MAGGRRPVSVADARVLVKRGVPGVLRHMEKWTEIRRRVLTGELSRRQACRVYKLHWETFQKVLAHVEPPGYRRAKARSRPKMERFLPLIAEILVSDAKAPKKQRHTAKRIFARATASRGGRSSRPKRRRAVGPADPPGSGLRARRDGRLRQRPSLPQADRLDAAIAVPPAGMRSRPGGASRLRNRRPGRRPRWP